MQPNNMIDIRLYFLDTKTQLLINPSEIKPDATTHNLPLNLFQVLSFDETSLYSMATAFQMIEAVKKAGLKEESIPLSLKTFLKDRNSKVNPVIIQVVEK